MRRSSEGGRVAAVDLGTRRIGVAVSDAERRTSRALGVVDCVGPKTDAKAIRALLEGLDVSLLVVGLPLHESGEDSGAAARARTVGADLARRLELPHVLVDESGTTLEARAVLRDASSRRTDVDAVAAALILDAWIAEQAGR